MEGGGRGKDHGGRSGVKVLRAEAKETEQHSLRVGVGRVGRMGTSDHRLELERGKLQGLVLPQENCMHPWDPASPQCFCI